MPKPKYTVNTSFRVFVNAYSSKQTAPICAEAQAWNSKHLGETLGQIADKLGTDPTYAIGWGIWLLVKFGAEIDLPLRKKVIDAVKDAMTAFGLYLTLNWLTDEEDKLLEEKFKGKLPTAENELEKGIVTRAKWQ